MLACLPLFSKEEQDTIRNFCQSHRGVIGDQDIRFCDAMKKFLHEIRGENPAFETAIVGQDLLDCFFVRANKDNERIKIQDGAFVIFGLETENNSRYIRNLQVRFHIIKHEDKKKFLADLNFVGINSSTIYPGLERTALYLRGKKLGWQKLYE